MIPLKVMKPKSASKKIIEKILIQAADPNNSYFKRNLSDITCNLKENLKKGKPIEAHIHSFTCSKSTIETLEKNVKCVQS